MNRAYGCERVWRQSHEPMDPTCQQVTVRAGGSSVMVWGVCICCDKGPQMRLETTMTGDSYISTLSNNLHTFKAIVHFDGLGKFQQDDAASHSRGDATERLQ